MCINMLTQGLNHLAIFKTNVCFIKLIIANIIVSLTLYGKQARPMGSPFQ